MIKPLVALVALVGAFYVSVTYEYGDPGWQLEFKTRPASAQTETPHGDYDLKSLQVLNRAVIHIKENYVDPSRISERKMIGGAMDEVMRSVPEVLVETENDAQGLPKRITVRVDQAEQTFDLGDVDNLWQMSFKFKDIFRFVQENLKHFQKFQDIEYAAINGMLKTLDPHSVLMRPDDYREMKLSTRGKFGGLGIVIAIKETHLTVVNPIEDTPASKAGIKAGDRIVQINQDSTVNLALQDAVDMLRGAPNGLVLDMRGNPGGLLDQAVAKVADLFLDRRRHRDHRRRDQPRGPRPEARAKGEGTEPNYPLVVLIDGGSASASEIVAGALKNHNRAVIVGHLLRQGERAGASATLPDGRLGAQAHHRAVPHPGRRLIQGVGITPDIARPRFRCRAAWRANRSSPARRSCSRPR
jgi:C-terminal processing protease CtpA/Prc